MSYYHWLGYEAEQYEPTQRIIATSRTLAEHFLARDIEGRNYYR